MRVMMWSNEQAMGFRERESLTSRDQVYPRREQETDRGLGSTESCRLGPGNALESWTTAGSGQPGSLAEGTALGI